MKYYNLIDCENIQDCKCYLGIMQNCIASIINTTNNNESESEMIEDAKVFIQFVYIKSLTIKSLLDGFGYEKDDYGNNHPIIDYQSLFSIVRDLYETFCAFELIYIYHDSDDKCLLIYNSFVLEGLMDRQRFKSFDNNKSKKSYEQEEIINRQNLISKTSFYTTTDDNNRKNLNKLIKQQKLIYIDANNNVNEFFKGSDYVLFGIKKDVFVDIYKYLSMNTHSSYISIKQYKKVFSSSNTDNYDLACMASNIAIILMSFFLSDFCKLFPECKSVLNKLDSTYHNLVTFYDKAYRE